MCKPETENEHTADPLDVAEKKLRESSIRRSGKSKVLQWEIRFPGLYLLFVVLNMLDLMVTKIAINQKGLDEANVLAKSVLVAFGFLGLTLYMLALTGLVIMLTEIISRKKPQWAFKLILFGCIAMGLVVLWDVLHVTMVTPLPT